MRAVLLCAMACACSLAVIAKSSPVYVFHRIDVSVDTVFPAALLPDQSFMAEASSQLQYDIALAELAMRKAENPAIRKVAGMLLNDGQRALSELKEVAGLRAIPVVPTTSPEYAMMDKLSSADFDEVWFNHMLGKQRRATQQYKLQFNNSRNVELKKWIMVRVPYFDKHERAIGDCRR